MEGTLTPPSAAAQHKKRDGTSVWVNNINGITLPQKPFLLREEDGELEVGPDGAPRGRRRSTLVSIAQAFVL